MQGSRFETGTAPATVTGDDASTAPCQPPGNWEGARQGRTRSQDTSPSWFTWGDMASSAYIVAFVCVLARQARADDETIIIVDRPDDRPAARDRERALGDAPFVTVIHPDEHAATA